MIFIFLIESPLASVPSLVSLFIMKIIIQKHCLSWAHYCDPEPTMYAGYNPRTAYWIIVNWHWHLTASGIRHIQKRQACCRYDVERIGIHIDIVTSKALDSMSYLSLIFYRGHFSHDIIIEWHSPSPSDWFDTPLFKGGGRSIDSFILHTAAKNWFTSFWFYIIVILLGRLNREILWKVPASVYSSHKFDDTVHHSDKTSNEVFDLLTHEVHYEEIIDAYFFSSIILYEGHWHRRTMFFLKCE